MSIRRTTTVTIPQGAFKAEVKDAFARAVDALEDEALNAHPAHFPAWDTLEAETEEVYDDMLTFVGETRHNKYTFINVSVRSISKEEVDA